MSQTLKQRVVLREVCRIGAEPKRLVDGMPYGPKHHNDAESHGDVNNFLARQIARGLKPKERT